MTTILALGDSFTCGEGVGVRVPHARTWTSLLSAALPMGRVVNLAEPGARMRDVRATQLPLTAGSEGALATVLAGLNDIARAGYDASGVRADLLATVTSLRRQGRAVLVGRLHDPTAVLPLPHRLRRVAQRRTSQINLAVDEAAADPGVLVLDLASVAALADPAGLAVDRLHPSTFGHAAIAAEAGSLLGRAGWAVAELPILEPPCPASRPQQARWLVTHGLPYLAGNVRDLGHPALTALVGRA